VGFSIRNIDHSSSATRLNPVRAICSSRRNGDRSVGERVLQRDWPLFFLCLSRTAGRRDREIPVGPSHMSKPTPTGPSSPASACCSPRAAQHLVMHAPCSVVCRLLIFSRAKPSSSSPTFHACPMQHFSARRAIVTGCHRLSVWYRSACSRLSVASVLVSR
jgi:hypothetical protein